MTIVEILTIHLSIGAPFGVLAFFGRNRASLLRSMVMTSIAVLFWPIVLLVRFQRRLAVRATVPNRVTINGSEFDEILDPILRGLSKHDRTVVEDYVYLTVAGSEYEHGPSSGYEEFLRLAGNSQASIGAACLSRQRNRQIVERLNRSRSQLIGTTAMESMDVRVRVAEICERLNDHETAERMRSIYSQEPIVPSAIPGPAVISARPEPF